MKALPQGKGLYIWVIKDMPRDFFTYLVDMEIKWIAVKVADGVNSFNLRQLPGGGWADDILGPFIQRAWDCGIKVLGWQYVYGFNPLSEADKAAQRIKKFNLDGFIIDAEHQYYYKPTQAIQYTSTLKKLVTDIPIALSSYRFPQMFPNFPFEEFLRYCDFNAPQVYWNEGMSEEETIKCFRQYENIKSLPFIPAGRAYYGEGFKNPPTADEINEFLDLVNNTYHDFGASAAFFWSADFMFDPKHAKEMKPARDAIALYKWEIAQPPEPSYPPDPPQKSHVQIFDDGKLVFQGDGDWL